MLVGYFALYYTPKFQKACYLKKPVVKNIPTYSHKLVQAKPKTLIKRGGRPLYC